MYYPEFGHIGFKLLCAFWGWRSIQYMHITSQQRQQKLDYMATISKSQRKQVDQLK